MLLLTNIQYNFLTLLMYQIPISLVVSHPSYLHCWGVEEPPDHVLAAAVGRQVEGGQPALAGQLPHQALGWHRGDLGIQQMYSCKSI